MATATALGLQVARRVRDYSQSEINAAGYLDFINMALDDLAAAGWLLPQASDTSITIAENDFDYAVPAGFAYIRWLELADPSGYYPVEGILPPHYWYITNDAQIYIRPEYHADLVVGRALRITGQKRPSTGVTGSDTITPGMEAFVRERAVSYAAETLAMGDSNLAGFRQRLADNNWAKSEKMLGSHPMEFRVKPSSVHVPGR